MLSKSKRRIIFIASILSLLLSAASDIFVKFKVFNALIIVDDNYIHSIFSAVITISSLSITVLTAIFSISDVKIAGVKLKNLLTTSNSPINYKKFVFNEIGMIIFSILALAVGMQSFLTIETIINVIYTTYSGYEIYKLMYNESYVYNIINKEIENNIINENHLVSWIQEYQESIIQRDTQGIEKYSNLIYYTIKDSESNQLLFQSYIEELFITAYKHYRFDESYNLVFNFNKKRIRTLRYIDTERIPIQIISKIENYSEEKIKKSIFYQI